MAIGSKSSIKSSIHDARLEQSLQDDIINELNPQSGKSTFTLERGV